MVVPGRQPSASCCPSRCRPPTSCCASSRCRSSRCADALACGAPIGRDDGAQPGAGRSSCRPTCSALCDVIVPNEHEVELLGGAGCAAARRVPSGRRHAWRRPASTCTPPTASSTARHSRSTWSTPPVPATRSAARWRPAGGGRRSARSRALGRRRRGAGDHRRWVPCPRNRPPSAIRELLADHT